MGAPLTGLVLGKRVFDLAERLGEPDLTVNTLLADWATSNAHT
jgi:hypothetical protein